MRILFIGDVFGEPAIAALEKHLPKIIIKEKVDFTIIQGENVSGRKGLIPEDYLRLKAAGVDAFTMGNHVFAKPEINEIINNDDIIRPYNVDNRYEGKGSRVFIIRGQKLRVTEMMGVEFNELRSPWKQHRANNFFDAFDHLLKNEVQSDEFHLLDFHAEVTSEKAVFGLYTDGKLNAFVGTHTHVQTNDARTLPKGTVFISDVGMTGPIDSAIGADYQTVYEKMRFGARVMFGVSENPVRMNAVVIDIQKTKNVIEIVNRDIRM